MSSSEDAYSGYTVSGTTPVGTTVNLFDYWISDQDDADGSNPSDYQNRGINADHQLKFGTGMGSYGTNVNYWTGSSSVRAGMVANTLADDGYPTLQDSGTLTSNSGYLNEESLGYLFNLDDFSSPGDDEVVGKEAYADVDGLLQVDDDGYYYYSSQSNFAVYDEDSNEFVLYDTWGVGKGGNSPNGQFFPFNTASEVFSINRGSLSQNGITSTGSAINHYFGMSMSTRFVQQYGGYTDESKTTAVTYEFSGDDDVWIYIDDVLVGDLGGIHDAASISIDFSTGEVVINEGTSYQTFTTLLALYEEAGLEGTTAWSGNTFADDTHHTLDFFYLERGNTDSNMSLKFNLVTMPESEIVKVDEDGEPVAGAEFALYPATAATDADGELTLTKSADTAVYTGTTGSDGTLVLVDDEDKIITFERLSETYKTNYFILEETSVPAGYRSTGDMWLEYVPESSTSGDYESGYVKSLNQWDTGSYAAARVQVTAPTNSLTDYQGASVSAYGDTGLLSDNAAILAVVMMRDESAGGSVAEGTAKWRVVTGSSTDGWTLGDTTYSLAASSGSPDYAELADAAESFYLGSSGLYQLMIDELPGDIESYYYTQLMNGASQDDIDENVKFTIAFYYTTDVNSIKASNTTLLDETTFVREYAARLYVPDVENELIVQKVDEDGNPVAGAEFSLYGSDDVETDAEGNLVVGEGATALATVTTDTLTKDNDGIDLEGAAVFKGSYLITDEDGYYYVTETAAPDGYAVNEEVVPVRMGSLGAYAYAGDEGDDDGVSVIKDVGSLVKTMAQFGTNDAIDHTLAYLKGTIYAAQGFDSLDAGSDSVWQQAYPEELHMTYDAEDTAARDYVFIDGSSSVNLDDLAVESGWVAINIQQCTDAAHTSSAQPTSTSTDLLDYYGGDTNYTLDQLFSKTTIVRVEDHSVADLAISKTVENKGSLTYSGATDTFTFQIDLYDEDDPTVRLDGSYTVEIYNAGGSLASTGAVSSGGTISLEDGQTAYVRDIPTGTTYTVYEEESNQGFATSVKVVNGTGDETIETDTTSSNATKQTGRVSGTITDVDVEATEAVEVTTLDYTNTYDATSKEVSVDYADADQDNLEDGDGALVSIGDTLAYTINWANYASNTATITIVDEIPEGTVYKTGTADAAGTGGVTSVVLKDASGSVLEDNAVNASSVASITWTLEGVASAATGSVGFSVEVVGFDDDSNTIANEATVSVGNEAIVTNEVDNYIPEKTVSSGDTELEEGATVKVGDVLTYSIDYINGTDEMATVTVTDTLSEGLSFDAAGDTSGAAVSTDTGTGVTTLTWTIENVPAGQSGTISFNVTVNENALSLAGGVENSASIEVGDSPAVTVTAIPLAVTTGNLTISKTVSANEGVEPDGDQVFWFQVNLSDDGSALEGSYDLTASGNYTYLYDADGNVVTDGGSVSNGYYVGLKADESVTIADLPEGATYTITECTYENDTFEQGTPDGYATSDGELTKTGTIESASSGQEADVTVSYVNLYSAVAVSIEGSKSLEGREWNEDESFGFTLTATGATLLPADYNATVTVTQDGSFSFDPIVYQAQGTYTYTVTENLPDGVTADANVLNGLAYDTTTYTVNVVVSENAETGLLEAAVTYSDGSADAPASAAFTNTYDPEDAVLETNTEFPFSKTLAGRAWAENESFTFQMTAVTEGAPMPVGTVDGVASVTVTEDNAESFGFEPVTYDTAGAYIYKVTEVLPDGAADNNNTLDGITYDTHVVTITVNVTDNGAGKLSAEYEVVGSRSFVNTYSAAPTSDTLTALKTVVDSTGNPMTVTDGEFIFYVVNDSTDSTIREASNDEDGKAAFDALSFSAAGEYSYTVRERIVEDAGYIYDESAYTVVYEVADDGQGNLYISSKTITKGNESWQVIDDGVKQDGVSDNITFTNEYAGVSKSVSASDGDTTIENADGELVSVGSTLTYTIEWRNYENSPAQVVITDAVPEGTTFVAGSATTSTNIEGVAMSVAYTNEGGSPVQADSPDVTGLTWTLDNVPADAHDTVSFSVTVDEAACENANNAILNDAEVTVGDHSPVVTNEVATYVPEKNVTSDDADVDGGIVQVGSTLDYEIEWVNCESDTATVTITDSIPAGTSYVYGTATEFASGAVTTTVEYYKCENGEYQKLDAVTEENATSVAKVVWTLGGVQPNTDGTVGFSVTVGADAIATTIENEATIQIGDSNPSVTTNTTSTTVRYTTASIQASKTLDGAALSAGQFSFRVVAEDGAPLPANYGEDGVVSNAADGAVDFGSITFQEAGTYTYTVTEVLPDGAADNNNTLDGITYDDAVYTVVYEVTDDLEGSLVAERTIYLGDAETGEVVSSISFENSYNADSVSTSAVGTIGGTKNVADESGSGYTLEADAFSFVLKDSEGNAVQTVSNAADGSYAFEDITFKEAGTYTYTVSEVAGSDANTGYSNVAYTVEFMVEDDGEGSLYIASTEVVSSDDSEVDGIGSMDFTNTYTPDAVSYGIAGTKTLTNTDSGTSRAIADGEFSFQLKDATTDEVLQTATNVGNTFSFNAIEYTEAGTFSYTVSEVAGDDPTITYDSAVYTVTVTVSGEGGVLSASADVTNDEIAFENSYTPTEVTIGPSVSMSIGGTKSYVGADGDPLEITEGKFSFELLDSDDEVVDTAQVDADGNFTFADITYTQTGTYTYTVREVDAGKTVAGITYDDTVYDVTVTVIEDVDANALVASVAYSLDGSAVNAMSFTNIYEFAATYAVLSASKTLSGATLADGQFTFQLFGSDGNVICAAANDASGVVTFDAIEYTQAGVYNYTIVEYNDGQEGIAYDATAYPVTVTVTDDGAGYLSAEVSYDNGIAAFANIYEGGSEEIVDENVTPADEGDSSSSTSETGDSSSPTSETGDRSMWPMALAFGVLLAALAAAIAVRRMRKQGKHSL